MPTRTGYPRRGLTVVEAARRLIELAPNPTARSNARAYLEARRLPDHGPRRDPQRRLSAIEARKRLIELAPNPTERHKLQREYLESRRLPGGNARPHTEHRALVYRQCPYCGNGAEWRGGGSAGAGSPWCTKCKNSLFVHPGDHMDGIPVERLVNGADGLVRPR